MGCFEPSIKQTQHVVSFEPKRQVCVLHFVAIVRSVVYRVPKSREISERYVESTRAMIQPHLAQAGVRLVWLLDIYLR